MRALKVTFRPEAVADLSDIFSYIARVGDLESAWRFVERIRARCRKIGDAPDGGRPRDDLAPGLRTVPFERKAVIAYVVEADRVRITNVFYGGRDYESLYGHDDNEG